jgi:copper chaperone CopZ
MKTFRIITGILLVFLMSLCYTACTSYSKNTRDILENTTVSKPYKKGMFTVHVKCQQSAFNVQKMLNEQDGVIKSDCNLNTMVATVEYDTTKTNLSKLIKVVAEGGYDAGELKANPKAKHLTPFCCQNRK